MRFSLVFLSLVVLLAAASADEIRIKVVDPQSAPLSGAQVELMPTTGTAPKAVQISSAEGLAIFHNACSGTCRVTVLAPGFAAQSVDVSSSAEPITVKLAIAPAAETVVVTATRTPVPSEFAGAEVDTLTRDQLTTMRPVAADDALRFLPGVVLGATGQRGSLVSLFVRGGDSTYNKMIVDGVTINEPGGYFDLSAKVSSQGDREHHRTALADHCDVQAFRAEDQARHRDNDR